MKRALITTTINVPHNLRLWRASGLSDDDVVIVAGDLKTPHAEVRALLSSLPGENVYLAPKDQTRWASSEVIAWNCIQRRNVALLEAMRRRPDYIITVDDDNFPVNVDHIARLDLAFTGKSSTMISTDDGWFNAGTLLYPEVVVRGFPLSHRHVMPELTRYNHSSEQIGVVASLWLGEPDIDAVERICCAPTVGHMLHNTNVTLTHKTWCPFNTQSTAFRTELAPFMAVWPVVGRYDDIWASFLTQRAMETCAWHVSFGHPLVHQKRNPHNLIVDLRAELFGMEHNERVIELIKNLPAYGSVTDVEIMQRTLRSWFSILKSTTWLPEITRQSFDAWYSDVMSALDIRESSDDDGDEEVLT